jgi:hypothetical protein
MDSGAWSGGVPEIGGGDFCERMRETTRVCWLGPRWAR